MKTILLCTTALLIAGCAVPAKPLCDREAQVWNKFNTVEDTCVDLPLVVTVRDKDGNPVKPTPDTPDEDDSDDGEDDSDDDSDDNGGDSDDNGGHSDEKSDNSDSNGKGGNKHDRDDKDDKSAHEKGEGKHHR